MDMFYEKLPHFKRSFVKLKTISLKSMCQRIWPAVHTDFGHGAKNIRMKNVIKGGKSIE